MYDVAEIAINLIETVDKNTEHLRRMISNDVTTTGTGQTFQTSCVLDTHHNDQCPTQHSSSEVHYLCHMFYPTRPTLSQYRPNHNMTTYFPRISFNLVLMNSIFQNYRVYKLPYQAYSL
jgi:hypothetical protein